jgi:Xaa-Pro dipeptidase
MDTLPAIGMEVARLREVLGGDGFSAVLLSEPSSICYVSGFPVPLTIGAGGAFAGGPNLAGVGQSTGALFVSAAEAGTVPPDQALDRLLVYTSFGHFEPVDTRAEFLAGLAKLLEAILPSRAGAVLGIESRSLPLVAAEFIAAHYPRVTLRDASVAIARARMIKSAREIALLRRAARAADAGQEALRAHAAPGITELSLWNTLCGAIEAVACGSAPITGELVSGPRTSVVRYPGGPIDRLVDRGDTIVCDISPCVGGYFADCCNTLAVDEPSAGQLRYFHAARDAWQAAVDTLRPGKLASDAADAARDAFARHGLPMAHYTGHGIGAAVNEAPRLVAYDRTPIEAGMVFAVEPGAYAGEGGTTGARTEKMVLVTADGPEVLSQFSWGLT